MVNILGINLGILERPEVENKIKELLNQKKQSYLVTPNPEIILASHKDEELFYILNKANLSVADGFGLKLAGYLYGEKIPRLTGADITLYLLTLAEKNNLRIVVLNWREGLSSKIDLQNALTKKYPKLKLLILDIERDVSLSAETINTINKFSAQILFVTFGAAYQEKVIFHNLNKLPSIRLALGVGGAFDFISERIRRAPLFLRRLGLEWFWRLIKQPKRWKRIYNATILFMYKISRARFINPKLYRPNVACLLYKKEKNDSKILIVQREDDFNHWQLPQGGTDGQSIAEAGARETREELGTNKFQTRAIFKNVYRYKFINGGQKKSFKTESKSSHEIKKYKYDYKGQKQSLYIAEFTGQDKDIKINFWDHVAWRWVNADKLVESVHPFRKKAAQIYLNKFKSLNI